MEPAALEERRQPDQKRRLALVALVTAVATALIVAPIVYLNGPTDDGIRCRRSASGGGCDVLQSYFPGIGGRSFAVDERDVAGAFAECGARGVGGHAAPSCRVLLRFKSGKTYPILSFAYAQPGVGRRAVERLNGYFADPSQRSIEVRNDLAALLALKLGAPALLLAVLVLAARRRR